MPDIRVRVEGGDVLQKRLGDPLFVRGPLRVFLRRASAIVEGHMKQGAPVDTGRLRSSITSSVGELSAAIGPTVTYAPHVEYGTRPHWPPSGALQPWARRHGFPAGARGDFMVRWIIAKRGTRAHPFAEPAARKSAPEIRAALVTLAQDINARWNGHAI